MDTAAAGARLEDLAIVARAAYEKWKQAQGSDDDGDGDGFEDRFPRLGTTFGNAGRGIGAGGGMARRAGGAARLPP